MKVDKLFLSALLLLCVSGCQNTPQDITGYVEGDLTYLTSPVAGTLKWLGVTRGDTVTENQLLYRLDSEPEASELLAAKNLTNEAAEKSKDLKAPARPTQLGVYEGQLKDAQALVTLTAARLARTQALYDKKFIQRDLLDAATSDLKSAKGKVDSLQSQVNEAKLGARENAISAADANVAANAADVRKAEWTLSQKTGVAVGAARVFDTYFQVGEYVLAGRPVLSLLLPRDIHIVFYLSADRMQNIKIGSRIQLLCASCATNLTGTVNYISPVAEFTPPVVYSLENTPKLAFRILAKPSSIEGLAPGQPVTIKLSTSTVRQNG